MKFDKHVVVGMATYNGEGRNKSLIQAINSLRGHGAKVFLYDNTKQKVDLTDNGKFFGLSQLHGLPCYYFSCDDDIIYPPNYIPDMVAKINEHKCIVTHHGRILTRFGVPYYQGHKKFRCFSDVFADEVIDVPGTGVTAFDTSYFNPTDLWKCPDHKMSDLVFGHAAASLNKKIMVLKHSTGYIKPIPMDTKDSIYYSEQNNPRLTEYADEILKLKQARN